MEETTLLEPARRLAIVGAGTMGTGIAQVGAAAGLVVTLFDVEQAALDRARQAIRASLDRLAARGTLAGDAPETIAARVTGTTDFAAVAAADVVIEAIVEDVGAKQALFRRLDATCRPGVLLASNTSSISITLLAAASQRADRVIGLHFFNPAPVMRLVEIVRGERTSDATFAAAQALAQSFGKTPVVVADSPGFVVNRLLVPLLNEAMYCLLEGVADRDAIDTAMRLGAGHPMGPLHLADYVGLDVCLQTMETLHRGLGDDKYRPCPLLRRMVAAGKLGRKSGEGFYVWVNGEKQ